MLVIHILQCSFSLTSFHLLAMWSNIRDDRMNVKFRDIITTYCPLLLLKRNLDISFSPKILGVGLLLYHSISWFVVSTKTSHTSSKPSIHPPTIYIFCCYLLVGPLLLLFIYFNMFPTTTTLSMTSSSTNYRIAATAVAAPTALHLPLQLLHTSNDTW